MASGRHRVVWFVVASVLASVASVFLKPTAFNEPYPFFHWALYAKPLNINAYEDYRIAVPDDSAQVYRLQPVAAAPGFRPMEYAALLRWLAQDYARTGNGARLHAFVKHVAPGHSHYQIQRIRCVAGCSPDSAPQFQYDVVAAF